MENIKNALGLADNRTAAQKFGDGVGEAANAMSNGIQGAAQTLPKDMAHQVGSAGQAVDSGAHNAADGVGNVALGTADALKGALGQKP
mmetsp:Transcript_1673/g.4563  ORF Transcript_1673/g.4563 Transcript_1673/m.4563 type:complete len:88 (+) Transcript_1673:142-405(+)|eukprot:CAMPEP_0184710736 /NCGR_PEP_ID=MMETSP0314-20130426/1495_1 /TAXON_ID=38298 /ORGANISM="Rhodella maculata, Strain CCMP 736" /LENGTH=87 /DNA_ID=CAMNT_0027172641 /DNA_START=119 /DNA_END=382 /DNA_ORIENTATION=+